MARVHTRTTGVSSGRKSLIDEQLSWTFQSLARETVVTRIGHKLLLGEGRLLESVDRRRIDPDQRRAGPASSERATGPERRAGAEQRVAPRKPWLQCEMPSHQTLTVNHSCLPNSSRTFPKAIILDPDGWQFARLKALVVVCRSSAFGTPVGPSGRPRETPPMSAAQSRSDNLEPGGD